RVLLREMGGAYRGLLRARDLSQSRRRRDQLLALHQAFLERPTGLVADAAVVGGLLDELRRALAEGRLSALGARYGRDLQGSLAELEQGRREGQPVTEAVMDALPPGYRE